jgi:hypothetical protein
MIPFIIIYCLFLILYFYTRPLNENVNSKKIWNRAINKYIMATMYLVYAIIHFKNFEFLSFHLILMIALFFAYLGDIFLVFDVNRGGDFFYAGNICFSIYYIALFLDKGLKFGNFFWVLIIWAVLLGGFIIASSKLPKIFKLGKMKFPMTFYLSSIMLHGSFGIGAMILLPSTATFVLGLGSVMFMLSDFILTVDKFVIRNTKWVVRLNSLFYFGGLLLIALSLGL